MAVLAEMKRASPSKGDIAVGVDAAQQGLTYAVSGACTISVLTEPTWFKGSLDDMRRVREALQACPCPSPPARCAACRCLLASPAVCPLALSTVSLAGSIFSQSSRLSAVALLRRCRAPG